MSDDTIRVVCVSDTHNSQPAIPDGDLFIHAGNLTRSGSLPELQATLDWIETLPHLHKVVIAGNHDEGLAPSIDGTGGPLSLNWGSIIYLQDNETTLSFPNRRDLKVYGSPWTPKFGNWVFQFPRGQDRWAGRIPLGIDILVTHGPPRFHLDHGGCGDESLLREVKRVRPKLHVFGHIHESYGRDLLAFHEFQASYDRIEGGEGGIRDLAQMAVQHVKSRARPDIREGTVLVNAAVVGGFGDNKRRQPIVVHI